MNAPTATGSERQLVLRAQAGDTQALAELFTRFWRAARASAYGVVADMSSAEDAAAEAFRLAVPGLKSLRDPDRFAPWLRRIVVRVAKREAKWKRCATEPLNDDVHRTVPDLTLSLQRRQMALLVREAVERLPPAEREAIVLYYFEGYAGDDAARFLGIPVGSLRRRLHDARTRLRTYLTDVLNGQAQPSISPKLRVRVDALLSSDASPEQWYDVMRDVLLSRPVPYQLLASLLSGVSISALQADIANRLLIRPQGPLFEDPGPVGDVARALRTALTDFQDWTIDSKKVFEAFPSFLLRASRGGTVNIDPTLMPPSFSSGDPGRYLRVTRGLLFGEGAAVDPAELFLRSDSREAFTQGMQPAWLSDVFDVYWTDRSPVELSEVEAWVTALARRVAPVAQARCALQRAPRYRTALRMDFAGDPRPAAIGGVLAVWPGAPEGVYAVHVRIYLEPWAQIRTGQIVATQSLRRPEADTTG